MGTQTKEKICTTLTPHWSLKRLYYIVFANQLTKVVEIS
jgi:hypothetical protein